jgi:flagellar basal body-associated protein FliL
MAEREPDFSRVERKKGRNRNKVLNIMIAVVVLLIVIASASIFLGNGNDDSAGDKEPGNTGETANDVTLNDEESDDGQDDDRDKAVEDGNSATDENKSNPESTKENGKAEETNKENSEESGSINYVSSDDDIIAETVIDTAWKPVGTTQTGEHVSLYDGVSADWNEKKQALSYATGLPQDSMIFLKIKNGGDPQKSIGIVSSRDSVQKYRVYLEWVDGEGWKPVKMDKLTTLDFEY